MINNFPNINIQIPIPHQNRLCDSNDTNAHANNILSTIIL